MSIGHRIKFCRKERGFTQSELAAVIGVSMQAVSKWETDTGMPDISQIVPLAKALEVSTDYLLGIDKDKEKTEIVSLREQIGKHKISFSEDDAKRIYGLAKPYFEKHPTNPEVAFWCLESLSVLLSTDTTDKEQIMKECEKYINCISRYETNADMIFKSYFVTARCFNYLGEKDKAEEVLNKVPQVFGDKLYWEAEFAYSEGNMELALEKCKESFAQKARYISRCIRMARMINESNESENISYQIELNKYMLNIIDAFLSGGNYMPARMVYQKVSLLAMLVHQFVDINDYDSARNYFEKLNDTRKDFLDFLKSICDSTSLMFPTDTVRDKELISIKDIDEYIDLCKKELNL